MLMVSAPDALLTPVAPPVPAARAGAFRQDVVRLVSISRLTSYPCACDEAVTRGVQVYGVVGSSGVTTRSSSQTLPFPPEPAVIASSIAAKRLSSLSLVGPHAKEICRFLRVIVFQSFGKTKFGLLDHHTFSAVESMSLNSSVLVGASPLMANENS